MEALLRRQGQTERRKCRDHTLRNGAPTAFKRSRSAHSCTRAAAGRDGTAATVAAVPSQREALNDANPIGQQAQLGRASKEAGLEKAAVSGRSKENAAADCVARSS